MGIRLMNTALMTQLAKLKVLQTTYALKREDYLYRITVDEDGWVLIKRTDAQHPMWSHGALTQAYDAVCEKFVMMIRVENMRLRHDEAEKVVAAL
jgi:hypothetical protein